jgi:hypothetical protein
MHSKQSQQPTEEQAEEHQSEQPSHHENSEEKPALRVWNN